MPIKVKGNISDVNYYALNGANENLVQVGAKAKIGNGNLQVSSGVDITTNTNNVTGLQPVFEIKGNYNLGEGFSVFGRFRDFIKTKSLQNSEQFRIGISKDITTPIEGLSVYVTGHATSKHDNNGWKHGYGGWVGASYNYKNTSAFVELQQNLKPNQKGTLELSENRSINLGISYTF